MPAIGLAVAAHSQAHSAELQWQHLQSQYRELGQLQSAYEAGHHSPLRRLLAKRVAAAAAEDEDEEGLDDSFDDDVDLDDSTAAGRLTLVSTYVLSQCNIVATMTVHRQPRGSTLASFFSRLYNRCGRLHTRGKLLVEVPLPFTKQGLLSEARY